MNSVYEITKEDIVKILTSIYQKIDENKDYLSKLDTEIGDGDHGFSIANGFKNIYTKLDDFSKDSIGDLLKKCGFELIKTVGGAAGAIFGTFFTGQASYYNKNINGKNSLSLEDIRNMLNEALTQIKKRGNAQIGDKTMIDAFEPALHELSAGVEKKMSFALAFKNASGKAKEGAESTKNMVGKHGRSKNVGERGIGFIDPGSMSTAFIFSTIADYFSNKEKK
ncbi:PEP-dependent dihydroxyacetone kinase, ADP-binding subunit DhaL [subsurface metagenome]